MHHCIYASLNRLMHHRIYLCIIEWTYMHHWTDWCITEYINAPLSWLMDHWIYLCIIEYTDASLNILMHHWIYLCIIEWIYASARHQLDLYIMEGIYASWNEFMHQPWRTYRRFVFLRQYCRYMFCYCSGSSMTCGCVVTWGDNRRWLMNMLWCVVDDLWMRRHNRFRMTYECVVMGVADLSIRHMFIVNYSSLDLFILCRGWLLNMLWCNVNDLWMRRHIGFRMTSEPVMVYVADLLIRHVLFIVNHSSLDLLICVVDGFWTCYDVLSTTYECVVTLGFRWLMNVSWCVSLSPKYITGCILCDLFVAGFVIPLPGGWFMNLPCYCVVWLWVRNGLFFAWFICRANCLLNTYHRILLMCLQELLTFLTQRFTLILRVIYRLWPWWGQRVLKHWPRRAASSWKEISVENVMLQ